MSLDEFDEVNPNEAVVAKKKMTLDRFLQQFNTLDMNNYGSWPLSVKITCWIMIVLMIGALGYFLVIRGHSWSVRQYFKCTSARTKLTQ